MTVDERKQKWSKPLSKNPNWKDGISKKICICGNYMSYNFNKLL